ncbi:MAG: hypothetical protein SFW66_10920 [Gammaproteobacteria bacterium]|nr:hypothetical protein [Gammaproteobacteria bacterium]
MGSIFSKKNNKITSPEQPKAPVILESKNECPALRMLKNTAKATNQPIPTELSSHSKKLLDIVVLGRIAEYQHDSYFQQWINFKTPYHEYPRPETERTLRFLCIFHEELNYHNQLTHVFFSDQTDKNVIIKENAFKMFLKAVMHDYVKLADKLLTEYPDFLTKTGSVQNKLNNTKPLENINALECACHEGSVDMIKMLVKHYKNPLDAFTILDRYYPDSLEIESKEDGLFDFSEIVEVINSHRTILEKYDVSVYIQMKHNLIDDDNTSSYTKAEVEKIKKATEDEIKIFEEMSQAIDDFRLFFIEYEETQDKNIALKNLLKTWNIYSNFYKNSKWSDRQKILFFTNIIGFIDGRLAINDAFANCQGLYNFDLVKGQPLRRNSLLMLNQLNDQRVKNINNTGIPFFSLSLGLSFGVFSYYAAEASGAGQSKPWLSLVWSPPPEWLVKGVEKLCRAKAERLHGVKEQLLIAMQQQSQVV